MHCWGQDGSGGRHWEGEYQECFALSFPMRVGSKRIPNAFIKADKGKSNVCWWIKENKESLSLIESGCTGRLTGNL